MGLFDSIGLGSVAKALDVGGLVKNVVDGVLPHQLASVGDFAGAVVDFKTGNIGGALQHAMETVRDLPQVARGQQPAAGNSSTKLNLWPSLPHEPPPPPLASRQGKDFDWNDLLAAMKALTAALNKQGTPGTAATASPATGTGTASTKPGTATTAATTTASTPAAASSQTPQPANSYAQAGEGVQAAGARHQTEHRTWWNGRPPAWALATQGWRGQPVAPARSSGASGPSNQTPAGTSTASSSTALKNAAAAVNAAAATVKAGAAAPAANNSAPATPTSGGKPPASDSAGGATTPAAPSASQPTSGKADNAKTDNAKASTGQTISSLAQLNGMSDAAIRDAVINGRISPDLLKDQNAMMVLQQRMNAIAEMNNLMTAMMRAIHDMQMAIVQNIRI